MKPLAILAIVLLLIATQPAQGITPTPYRAVPQSGFSRIAPVDAGSLEPQVPVTVGITPIQPSILPSGSPGPTTRPVRPPRTYLSGVATFYVYITGQAAAAKPLRDFLGAGWRGSFVRVCHDGLCLRIRLTDWESSLLPGRLVDLSSQDFRRICGPLSQGICEVRISR